MLGIAPLHVWLAVLVALVGTAALCRGVALFLRALRRTDDPDSSLWLIRGIRGIVVAVSAASLVAGLLVASTGLLVFGAVFLGEELYETGVVALVLRGARSDAAADTGSDVLRAIP
jgi:uncharacterized membrane protein HdeD (DUF308 family)